MVEGLSSLLGEVPNVKVVGTAGTVKDAVEAARALDPHVVLMDFRLPDGNGAEATERIRKEHSEVAVVFLSADISDDAMMQAVDAGACGYVSKSATTEELTSAVLRAAEGEFLFSAATMTRLLMRQRESRRTMGERARLANELTPREHDVLRMMATGLDNYDIADKLG